jgi:hypothetical protein
MLGYEELGEETMKLKLKEILVFFLTFLAGTYGASYVTTFLNLKPTDMLSSLGVSFIAATFVFLIWVKWTRKYSGGASAR